MRDSHESASDGLFCSGPKHLLLTAYLRGAVWLRVFECELVV